MAAANSGSVGRGKMTTHYRELILAIEDAETICSSCAISPSNAICDLVASNVK